MQCYIPITGIVRINDTLKYNPEAFDFPKTTTEDYLQQAIGDILAIIQDPLKTISFLSYEYETKNSINKISHILQESKAQTWLLILPLPPMLPYSQTRYLSPFIITHPAAQSQRV